MYGLNVPASAFTPQRDALAIGDRTPSGNFTIDVGRELPATGRISGWEKIGHIVMEPEEARMFAEDILKTLAA